MLCLGRLAENPTAPAIAALLAGREYDSAYMLRYRSCGCSRESWSRRARRRLLPIGPNDGFSMRRRRI